MPSPEQLEELQKLLPQVATPDTTLAIINGLPVAAKDLVGELRKMPKQDIASMIEDLKLLDAMCPGCAGKGYVTFGESGQYTETCRACGGSIAERERSGTRALKGIHENKD